MSAESGVVRFAMCWQRLLIPVTPIRHADLIACACSQLQKLSVVSVSVVSVSVHCTDSVISGAPTCQLRLFQALTGATIGRCSNALTTSSCCTLRKSDHG